MTFFFFTNNVLVRTFNVETNYLGYFKQNLPSGLEKNIGPQAQDSTCKGTIEDFLFHSKICLKSISIRRLPLLSKKKNSMQKRYSKKG